MKALKLLLPLAMLALGYVLGRQSVGDVARTDRSPRPVVNERPDRPAKPTAVPESEVRPAKTATATNAESCVVVSVPPRERPDREIYLPVEWHGERFVHWYRSHAATYEFTPRTPEQLRSFGAEIIEKLGRIPRRELLDRLLDAYVPLHAAVREVDAALKEGKIARHEVEARLAPARRLYSYKLYRTLAFSDYLFLTREWADHKSPYRHFRHERPPTSPRPQGGDPYAIPLGSLEKFVAWYQAYRHDLDLPERDHDFLNPFFGDIVGPLGRVPQPKLMRPLQKLYAAYQENGERGDDAVRELFHGLRSVLDSINYDRIRWSQNWSERLQELGLLK